MKLSFIFETFVNLKLLKVFSKIAIIKSAMSKFLWSFSLFFRIVWSEFLQLWVSCVRKSLVSGMKHQPLWSSSPISAWPRNIWAQSSPQQFCGRLLRYFWGVIPFQPENRLLPTCLFPFCLPIKKHVFIFKNKNTELFISIKNCHLLY